jgi:hypothetical protein
MPVVAAHPIGRDNKGLVALGSKWLAAIAPPPRNPSPCSNTAARLHGLPTCLQRLRCLQQNGMPMQLWNNIKIERQRVLSKT